MAIKNESEAVAPVTVDNMPEFSVSEVSQAIKRTLEGRFERVRVRGEISGFKRAASGHLYMALKDEKSVLDAVCWRGTAGRLALAPEDGLEVIATGRITSYPGRSKYQIVIESLELAGEGALLKLLEERRKALAAEGLFDAARKRPLPFLPEVIGVVTSPTGAVIRDILHRLRDRFPRRVLVWPVLVQGEGAAAQVAAAIEGFNALPSDGPLPRPELLIVARGGGSLEDLWTFNEEIVVRAAAASAIPLISAVGHETDTTLIDFAADRRAPTPTAAAEMAVPLRGELMATLQELDRRQGVAAARLLEERRVEVRGLGRGLPRPERILETLSQQLDDRAERLGQALRGLLQGRRAALEREAAALPHPRQLWTFAAERLAGEAARLAGLGGRLAEPARRELARLEPDRRLAAAWQRRLAQARERLAALGQMLGALSYEQVLERGFALVHGPAGLVTSATAVKPGVALDLQFADGRAGAVGAGEVGSGGAAPPRKAAKSRSETPEQGSLL